MLVDDKAPRILLKIRRKKYADCRSARYRPRVAFYRLNQRQMGGERVASGAEHYSSVQSTPRAHLMHRCHATKHPTGQHHLQPDHGCRRRLVMHLPMFIRQWELIMQRLKLDSSFYKNWKWWSDNESCSSVLSCISAALKL